MRSLCLAERPVDVWAPQVAEILSRVDPIAYVAGGAARQLVMPKDAPLAMDIDLFLRNSDALDECCRCIASLGYRQIMDTENAVIYEERSRSDLPVQIIKPWADEWSLTYGTPTEVLSAFSFTTEQFAIAPETSSALVGPSAIDDTRARRLIVANVTDPIIVAMRAVKYAYKGYEISVAEMHRIFVEWDNRPNAWKHEVAVAQGVA